MSDLNNMSVDDFAKLIGQSFVIDFEGNSISLELIEVSKMGAGERDRGAFSLVWQGPKSPSLNQATYLLANDEIGSHHMFVVPISEVDLGIQYEAIFT